MRYSPTYVNFAVVFFLIAVLTFLGVGRISPILSIALAVAAFVVPPWRGTRDIAVRLLIVFTLLFGGFVKGFGVPNWFVAFVFTVGGVSLLMLEWKAPNKSLDLQALLIASVIIVLGGLAFPLVFCGLFPDKCVP